MYLTTKLIVIFIVFAVYCTNNAVSRSIHKLSHHHRHEHHKINDNNSNSKIKVRGLKSAKTKNHSRLINFGSLEGQLSDNMVDEADKMADHLVRKRQNGRNIEDVIWKNLQHKIMSHKTLDELLYRNVAEMENEAVCNYTVTKFSSNEHELPINLSQVTCNVGDLKEFCKANNYERCCVQTYSTIFVERKDGSGSDSLEVNNGCIYARLPEIKGLKADVETDY